MDDIQTKPSILNKVNNMSKTPDQDELEYQLKELGKSIWHIDEMVTNISNTRDDIYYRYEKIKSIIDKIEREE